MKQRGLMMPAPLELLQPQQSPSHGSQLAVNAIARVKIRQRLSDGCSAVHDSTELSHISNNDFSHAPYIAPSAIAVTECDLPICLAHSVYVDVLSKRSCG